MTPPAALETAMVNAQELVEEIRRELAPVEEEIRRHPYLSALEAGRVRREDLPASRGSSTISSVATSGASRSS